MIDFHLEPRQTRTCHTARPALDGMISTDTRGNQVAKTKKTERTYRILTEEEGRTLFDEEAQRLLGISGEEFVRRYDAGYYDDKPDLHEEVIELHLMLPLFRRVTVP